MRVIALVASYNEERFIRTCLEHLFSHGVEVCLIDNESTDHTVAIAAEYLNKGLIKIETLPRESGAFCLRAQLLRKEQLASELDADWFIHLDPDEIRLPPPRSGNTLAQALDEADAQGFNAVNFLEFAFTPTRESPDHDHADFQKTMRWYYPMLPSFPHRLNAWKKQPHAKVELLWSGGHRVRFPDLRMFPQSFLMKHYLFLSIPHAISKYIEKKYDAEEVARFGWHRWRSELTREMLQLPSENELRIFTSDDQLDPSEPRARHYLAETWAAFKKQK